MDGLRAAARILFNLKRTEFMNEAQARSDSQGCKRRVEMSECGATLDVDMILSHSEGEEETDGGEVWGRLFPLGKGFVAQGVSLSHEHQCLCS